MGKLQIAPSPTKTFNYYTMFDEMVAKRDTTKDEFKLPKNYLHYTIIKIMVNMQKMEF